MSTADPDPDPDPAAETRATYDVIAAAYDARNSPPLSSPGTAGMPGTPGTPDGPRGLEEWRDNWISLVLDRTPAGLAPATQRGSSAATAAAGEPGPRVLDAGAGPGRDTAAFGDAGLDAVALDLSASMAALARGRGVRAVLGDQRRPPFADGTFDALWSCAALLHVPRADVPATLREWRRVTAPGGLLGLSTATDGTDGWEDVPYDTGVVPVPRRWFVYHDEPALRRLLDEAGWHVESVDTYAGRRTWLQVLAVARG